MPIATSRNKKSATITFDRDIWKNTLIREIVNTFCTIEGIVLHVSIVLLITGPLLPRMVRLKDLNINKLPIIMELVNATIVVMINKHIDSEIIDDLTVISKQNIKSDNNMCIAIARSQTFRFKCVRQDGHPFTRYPLTRQFK